MKKCLFLILVLLSCTSGNKSIGFLNVKLIEKRINDSLHIDIKEYADAITSTYSDAFIADSILPHLYDPYDLRGNQLIDQAFEDKKLPELPQPVQKAKMMRYMWEGILPAKTCYDPPNDSLCKLRKRLKEYVPVNLTSGGAIHMAAFQITVAEMHETGYQTSEELHLLLAMDYIFRNGKD